MVIVVMNGVNVHEAQVSRSSRAACVLWHDDSNTKHLSGRSVRLHRACSEVRARCQLVGAVQSSGCVSVMFDIPETSCVIVTYLFIIEFVGSDRIDTGLTLAGATANVIATP